MWVRWSAHMSSIRDVVAVSRLVLDIFPNQKLNMKKKTVFISNSVIKSYYARTYSHINNTIVQYQSQYIAEG